MKRMYLVDLEIPVEVDPAALDDALDLTLHLIEGEAGLVIEPESVTVSAIPEATARKLRS